MNLQKTYTALLTADLVAAEGWYSKLLGRSPDHRPMDTLVQWEFFAQGGLMLSTSNEIAGRDPDGNLITLATPPARPFPSA